MTQSTMASRSVKAATLVVTAALAFSTATGSARAQATGPKAADKETARRLMEQGRDRLEHHDNKGALEAFKAADEIMHAPPTGLMVANEQANLGLLVEARETLARVLRTPPGTGEPEAFQRARKAAEELNEAIEGRIPSLRIEVRGESAGATVQVLVDEVALTPAVLKFPYRLNPGHHALVAKAGEAMVRREVDVREREAQVVVLDLAPAKGGAEAPPPVRPEKSSGSNTLAIVGFSVAGAGVIAGTVTGILMFSKKSALDDGCVDKACPPSTHDDYSGAHTMATISTISFVVAGVGAGVGIYGLLTNRRTSTPSGAAVTIEPWASAGAGGVRGSF